MHYIPVTQTRRQRKSQSRTAVNPGLWLVLLAAAVVVAAFKMVVVTKTVLVAVGTLSTALILFLWSLWELFQKIVSGIQGGRGYQRMREDDVRRDSGWRRFLLTGESVLSIIVCASLLYLLQPFITALLWWQSYKLMTNHLYPITIVNRIFNGIETIVDVGVFVCLGQVLWKEWSRLFWGKESGGL